MNLQYYDYWLISDSYSDLRLLLRLLHPLLTKPDPSLLHQIHSSLLFKQHLLFLWQRELQSLPAFLQAQLFDMHSPLQLHFTIPWPPTDDT
jgi:hypothetical protein